MTSWMPSRSKIETARLIAEQMSRIAHPDSRFGRDFTQFIPAFDGAGDAASKLLAMPELAVAKRVFITPDNAVAAVRRMLIEAGVDLLVPSYGLYRGFVNVTAADIPDALKPNAGWLDAIDHYGTSHALDGLPALGPVDAVITGASAVTFDGLRFGMGDFYLDIEWPILRALGLVGDETMVAAVVHDRQLTDIDLGYERTNVRADLIVTPTQVIRVPRASAGRPTDLDWTIVPSSLLHTATLKQFRAHAAAQTRSQSL